MLSFPCYKKLASILAYFQKQSVVLCIILYILIFKCALFLKVVFSLLSHLIYSHLIYNNHLKCMVIIDQNITV